MPNASKKLKQKLLVPRALCAPLLGIFSLCIPAYAQSGSSPGISLGNVIYGAPGTTTLTDPLIPGASFSMPFVPAAPGAPPPPGSGLVPLPVNPGMIGPSLIPWANGVAGVPFSLPTNQAVIPANQIDQPSSNVSLPASNFTALPPGAFNAMVGGSIPHAPSTPGADPGMLRPPSFANGSSGASAGQNNNSAAGLTTVDQNGQLPPGAAPTSRPKGQSTKDFGLLARTGQKQFFASRLQGTNWVGQAGSNTQDFGLGVNQLKGMGQLGSKAPNGYQVSYDAPANAQYPGQSSGGSQQNSKGNHNSYFGSDTQVTNDLGVPMVRASRYEPDGEPSKKLIPLTTIAPY